MADPFSYRDKKIWVAGHTGLVGSALLRKLQSKECDVLIAPKSQLDLRDKAATFAWMDQARPDVIVLAAAKVGGIAANAEYPVEFMNDNIAIAQNVITAAAHFKTEKLVFLGSSCIYPKNAEQPIREEYLLSGPLELTNEAYALAKITGLKLCEYYRRQYGHDFISVMPCNLYGPNDHWDDEKAHVIPALIKKFHRATMRGEDVVVWGSGTPYREFLYVDDAADGILHAAQYYSSDAPLNMGFGSDIAIADLARLIARVTHFKGHIHFDATKPDGVARKLLSSERIMTLGWKPKINLEEGLSLAYQDFLRTR